MNQDYQNLYQSGMSDQSRNPNPQTLTKAAPNQPGHPLYSYCIVMRAPKLGPVPIVVTVLVGLILMLLFAALGESLLTAVAIGGLVSAVFAFLSWIACRLRSGSAKRLNSYLSADGGQSMFSDFDAAQPFANDQFRVGRQYLFIKNSAVLRLDSITDIVRINNHYRFVPTGVSLSVKVNDAHGSMVVPLCRLHVQNAQAEFAEIRNVVMQRRDSVQE